MKQRNLFLAVILTALCVPSAHGFSLFGYDIGERVSSWTAPITSFVSNNVRSLATFSVAAFTGLVGYRWWQQRAQQDQDIRAKNVELSSQAQQIRNLAAQVQRLNDEKHTTPVTHPIAPQDQQLAMRSGSAPIPSTSQVASVVVAQKIGKEISTQTDDQLEGSWLHEVSKDLKTRAQNHPLRSMIDLDEANRTLATLELGKRDDCMISEVSENNDIAVLTVKLHDSDAHKRGKILLLCVHGTWSTWDAFGVSSKKVETPEIINNACALAKGYGKDVDIVAFKWSGKLDRNDRIQAGIQLFERIKDHVSSYDAICTISHSHGCSVVGKFAECLGGIGRAVDAGIFLAGPDLDDARYVNYFKKLYQFYGSADFTQFAGSLENQWTFARKMALPRSSTNRVWNIRMQADGVDCNHVNIKFPVLKNLVPLLYMVDTYYPCHYDLDAHVHRVDRNGNELLGPIIAIRKDDNAHRCNHHSVRQIIQQSLEFSAEQKGKFSSFFNDRPIARKGLVDPSRTWFGRCLSAFKAFPMAFGEWWSRAYGQDYDKTMVEAANSLCDVVTQQLKAEQSVAYTFEDDGTVVLADEDQLGVVIELHAKLSDLKASIIQEYNANKDRYSASVFKEQCDDIDQRQSELLLAARNTHERMRPLSDKGKAPLVNLVN